MNSYNPIVVLDPYEWLPGHGENEINFHSKGLEWGIEILYDDESQDEVWKRNLVFHKTRCFYKASFPGPSILNIDHHDMKKALGSLIEYQNSDAADKWNTHLKICRDVKHYCIIFLPSNSLVEVVAESFSLTEPIRL